LRQHGGGIQRQMIRLQVLGSGVIRIIQEETGKVIFRCETGDPEEAQRIVMKAMQELAAKKKEKQ